jgi:hypothetical protein
MSSGQNTIHRGKNRCRLTLTGEIEFSTEVLRQICPYDPTALTVLRKLLDDGLRLKIIESYINSAMKELEGKRHILTVSDFTVEAAP